MKRVVLLFLLTLALPTDGLAAEIVRHDAQGRPIRFDVRFEGADVEWFAGLLRRAAHGDEIGRVTIRLVSFDELATTCSRRAAGCYRSSRGRGLVIVPGVRSATTAHTLLHEYGHHVDHSIDNGELREPNGTPTWWRARGMEQLRSLGSVTSNYSLGWERSIGEVFAEDYARINLGGEFKIWWLRAPDRVVRRAILADLGLASAPAGLPRRPQVRALAIDRDGTLEPGERETVSFGLLGPGRRAIVSARSTGGAGSARVELACTNRVVRRDLEASARIDVRNLGPGRCEVRVVSTSGEAVGFSLRVRVSIAV
jgi:hypothetical protein